MGAPIRPRSSLVLILGLAIALLASGFGHPMPAPPDAALARFLAAGGNLGDICDHGSPDAPRDRGACCLATPVALPDPPTIARSVTTLTRAAFRLRSIEAPPRATRDPAHGERAPPTPLT